MKQPFEADGRGIRKCAHDILARLYIFITTQIDKDAHATA